MEVAPEEVEALPALPEADHTGLVRVQAKTEVVQQLSGEPPGPLGLPLGLAQHHEPAGLRRI
jgi:hypothetical protein